MVGTLNDAISEKRFRIEYPQVIDSYNGCLDAKPKYVNAELCIRLMLSIAEPEVSQLRFDKIIMSTHKSWRLFNLCYKYEDFSMTDESDQGVPN